jgi:hypothetical protein
VEPGTDQQSLVGAGLFVPAMFANANEIAQGIGGENVVPAADVKRRHLDPFIWAKDELPVIIRTPSGRGCPG